ncbi:unnamed protein product, partial [Ectocarpus sp. 12 AP-2014]
AFTSNVGRWTRERIQATNAHTRLNTPFWVGSSFFSCFSSVERRVAEIERLRRHRHAHARVTTTTWPPFRCQVPSFLRRNCTIADARFPTGRCLEHRMDNEILGGRERSSGW